MAAYRKNIVYRFLRESMNAVRLLRWMIRFIFICCFFIAAILLLFVWAEKDLTSYLIPLLLAIGFPFLFRYVIFDGILRIRSGRAVQEKRIRAFEGYLFEVTDALRNSSATKVERVAELRLMGIDAKWLAKNTVAVVVEKEYYEKVSRKKNRRMLDPLDEIEFRHMMVYVVFDEALRHKVSGLCTETDPDRYRRCPDPVKAVYTVVKKADDLRIIMDNTGDVLLDVNPVA